MNMNRRLFLKVSAMGAVGVVGGRMCRRSACGSGC